MSKRDRPVSSAAPDVRNWVCDNVKYDRKITEPATAMTPGITDLMREHLAAQPYHWRFLKDKRQEMLASCQKLVKERYQPPPEVTQKCQQPAGATGPGEPAQFIFLGVILSAIVSAVVGKVFSWLWDKWFSQDDTAHSQLAMSCGMPPPAAD